MEQTQTAKTAIEILSGFLHILLCDKLHTADPESMEGPDTCGYYLEDLLASDEPKPTHDEWISYAEVVAEDLKLDTLEDVRQFGDLIADAYGGVKRFITTYPNDIAKDILWEIISPP